MVTGSRSGCLGRESMLSWIKRFAHLLAVTLYGTFELLDIPRIRDLPGDKDPSR
jgi:hypothetical protein